MTQASPTAATPLPPGRIDIHSHLLPGIDDGCRDLDDSFACIERLMVCGYVGTICTPHLWDELYPNTTAESIRRWTAELQARIDQRGLAYRLWPGAEIRLYKNIAADFKNRELPTLAGGRCVLVDFWTDKWEKWINPAFEGLLAAGYQPILAHPERLKCTRHIGQSLDELVRMGVWLQGNFRCMTGEEGYAPDVLVRQFLRESRYHFMALDMHRPETLGGRLDGAEFVAAEFGAETLERLTAAAPRQRVLNLP
jgi:protein-tyrosine phosphatase